MNILILGELSSGWTYKCIDKPGLDQGNQITVYGYEDARYKDCYEKKGICLAYPCKIGFLKRIPYLGYKLSLIAYVLGAIRVCRKIGQVNCLHISFVDDQKLGSVPFCRKYCERIICSFWGSDIFRRDEAFFKRHEKGLSMIDLFALSTDRMERRFKDLFGNRFAGKIRRISFGVEGLDYINTDPGVVQTNKREFNIPPDKITITVGYNGREEQQHIDILKAIRSLPEDLHKRIFLQFPFTYGSREEYKFVLKQELDRSGIEYQLIEQFMDEETLGRFRTATDIFIHGQTTDAASASVKEYLYAQKIVLNGKWLTYDEMINEGVFYYHFADFNDLADQLRYIVEKGLSEDEKKRIIRNSSILKSMYSWESVSSSWRRLYCGKV